MIICTVDTNTFCTGWNRDPKLLNYHINGTKVVYPHGLMNWLPYWITVRPALPWLRLPNDFSLTELPNQKPKSPF